jgi:hypothetical protein
MPGSETLAQIPEGFGEGKRVRRKSVAWTVRREAYLILKQAGTPLDRSEILRELERRGIKVDSPHPAKAIGKILWKAAEFEHQEGGYWIKERSAEVDVADAAPASGMARAPLEFGRSRSGGTSSGRTWVLFL